MSTLNLIPKIIREGDGVQKRFDFSFPARESTEIEVYVLREGVSATASIKPLSFLDYDVEIDPSKEFAGTVVFPGENSKEAILSSKDKICIMRKTRLGNDYLFSNQTRLLPKTVEDADDALSLQIMDLSRDLSMAVKASPFDDRTPEKRWEDIQAEVERAKNLLDFINKEFVDLPQKVATEKADRVAADNEIKTIVATNKEDCNQKISAVAQAVEEEKVMREDADKAFVKTSHLSLCLTTAFVVSEENSVSLKFDTRNTVTGDTYTSIRTLPVASRAQHGVMPKEAYSTLEDLTSKVAALEGSQAKTYALSLGSGPFAQENYQRAWENAAGVEPGTTPPDGTKITNIDTNIDIQYYASSEQWVERQISVPVATELTTGAVKGSTVKGKVAVEPDGSMSLNGYDELSEGVTNAASAISSETSRATGVETEISGRVDSHISDTVRHITDAERSQWNGKYSKPDSGVPLADLDESVQEKINDALSKTNGGVMGGQLVARSVNLDSFEVRNIMATSVDPGDGSALASGNIILVFE